MTDTPLRWECTTCLLDYPEPFCSSCGKDISDAPLFGDPYGVQADLDRDDNFSRKVPAGPRSNAEIRRIVREQGIQAALMVVSLDAVYAAMKPGKASLR